MNYWKTKLQQFLGYSLPIKLLFGSLATVIAGPGLIGFLSEYATYSYSLNIGIRAPLEGIPYLKAAVTTLSLGMAVLAGLVFLLTRALVIIIAEGTLNLIHSFWYLVELQWKALRSIFIALSLQSWADAVPTYSYRKTIVSFKNLKPLKAILISIFVSLIAGICIYLISDSERALSSAVIFPASMFIAMQTIWSTKAKWWVSVAAILTFYYVSIFSLFNLNYYSYFLKTIGYGGWAPISIEYKSEKDIKLDGYLMLRTNNSLILQSNNNELLEIQLNNIQSIKYHNYSPKTQPSGFFTQK